MKRLLAVLALILFAAAPALATTTRPMSTHPTEGQLQSSCDAVGGDFMSYPEDEGGGYRCDKKNCDGKGGTCTVSCGVKSCTAITPIVIGGPVTLIGILQNGLTVLRDDDLPTGSISTPVTPTTDQTKSPGPVLF